MKFHLSLATAIGLAGVVLSTSCTRNDSDDAGNPSQVAGSQPILLVLDEESIDNGNEPNRFSEVDVNDQLATVGQRRTLEYFKRNVGKVIDLHSGQVGDEGWFSLRTIPNNWVNAGPTATGAMNFLKAGPGLGSGRNGSNDDKEVLLDNVTNVVPLRATALQMLVGSTVLAVVYDGNVGINYSPLRGNLMGANLGVLAFDVISVTRRTDGSSSSLPQVRIQIRDAEALTSRTLQLFRNVPIPASSSEPMDITPPANAAAIILENAQ
jgi:hypothetical protein